VLFDDFVSDQRPACAQDVIGSVAHHIAEMVTVFDAAGNLLWVNAAVERLLGWQRSDWDGLHGTELVHPDDLALGMELLSSARATGTGVKEPVVYRLGHRDGSWVDLECIASAVELEGGQVLLVVTSRPANEIRPSTAIFDEAAARVSSMFDDATIGMAQVALDGSVLRANNAFAELVGSEPEQLVGHLPPEIVALALEDDGRSFRDQQVTIEHLDGTVRHARVSQSLVRDHRGAPMYNALQAVDVTDLVVAERELRHRSTHDPLTGLANRAVLDRIFDSDELRGTTALIYLDLDRFKPVNDAFGHAAGDEVLCSIAVRLRRQVREVDVVVRLGGDEFVIVCGDVDRDDALSLADRLVSVCADPIEVDQATIHVEASAGVAFTNGAGLGDLLRRADTALYRAKIRGASVMVADDESAPGGS